MQLSVGLIPEKKVIAMAAMGKIQKLDRYKIVFVLEKRRHGDGLQGNGSCFGRDVALKVGNSSEYRDYLRCRV